MAANVTDRLWSLQELVDQISKLRGEIMSSLRTITIAFLLALPSAVAAQTQQTYTVYNWPDDLAKLPCDAL